MKLYTAKSMIQILLHHLILRGQGATLFEIRKLSTIPRNKLHLVPITVYH